MQSPQALPGTDARLGRRGILMSDLRGFTALTEQQPLLAFVPLLNRYFEEMTLVIDRHGGIVDKFMGDSVLAWFELETDPAAAYRMLSCAIDMQIAMDRVNAYGKELGLPELYMGIGLDAGEIIGCTLGSRVYRVATILGEPVNTASRMATIALRGQVLASDEVVLPWQDRLETGTDYSLLLKGKQRVVKVHEILGILYPDNKVLPRRENRRYPRVEAFLPVSYSLVRDKRVLPGIVKAEVTDLSYGGMRLYTPFEHHLLDELRILVPFALGQERVSEVYARVLSSAVLDADNFVVSVEYSHMDEFARKSIRALVDRLV